MLHISQKIAHEMTSLSIQIGSLLIKQIPRYASKTKSKMAAKVKFSKYLLIMAIQEKLEIN